MNEKQSKKYYIKRNDKLECHQIMLKDGICDDGKYEDSVVADVYDIGGAYEFFNKKNNE